MKYIFVVALSLLLNGEVHSEENSSSKSDSTALLAKLESRFASIKTVQSRFTEKKTLKIFDHVITIKGRFCLENPDKLAWRIDSPVKYVLVLDGDYATQWDQESGRKQKIKTAGDPIFEQVLGQIKKWFSGRFKSLLKDFDMKIISVDPVKLRFEPIKDSLTAKAVKSVTISVCEDMVYVEQILLEDVSGDLTEITFHETVLNESIAADEWKAGFVEK